MVVITALASFPWSSFIQVRNALVKVVAATSHVIVAGCSVLMTFVFATAFCTRVIRIIRVSVAPATVAEVVVVAIAGSFTGTAATLIGVLLRDLFCHVQQGCDLIF